MNAPLNHDALASIADELVGAGIASDVAQRAAERIMRHQLSSADRAHHADIQRRVAQHFAAPHPADKAALRAEAAQAAWDAHEADHDSDPYFGGGSAWS